MRANSTLACLPIQTPVPTLKRSAKGPGPLSESWSGRLESLRETVTNPHGGSTTPLDHRAEMFNGVPVSPVHAHAVTHRPSRS